MPDEETQRVARLGPRPLQLCLQLALAGQEPSDAATIGVERFLAGLQAYWRHPYRRAASQPSVLWRHGGARLLDLGAPHDPPVLVIPSLINRAYILDLMPGHSLLRHLAASGLRPLLLDWGHPTGGELALDLAQQVLVRAGGALEATLATTRRPPVLLGYCMGGVLACALAAAREDQVAGLALLATPWDFHAGEPRPTLATGAAAAGPSAMIAALGYAPVELLQSFFLSLDGAGVVRKFQKFAELRPDDPRAALFVAVEDWLNDGVPLAGPAAQECLWHWYVENRPARGTWSLDGVAVRPERLGLPAFLALPRRDRIVPVASAQALADRLARAMVVRPPSGHVGMVVGAGAKEGLWDPLASWLRRIAPRRAARPMRPACASIQSVDGGGTPDPRLRRSGRVAKVAPRPVRGKVR